MKRISQLKKSRWLFPALLLLILLLLVALRINGSSIGIYDYIFSVNKQDSSIKFGNPRPVRSDEWLVDTQLVLAQSSSSFPSINNNFGNGQDMSLIYDMPYKQWTVLFKPHLLAFFIMPLDYAFAFKWWFMAFLLIISSYLVILRIMPRRHILAALLSLAFFFSPFIQWWYQYSTIGTLAWAFFGIVAVELLLTSRSTSRRVIATIALIYSMTAFVFVMYPPFLIACAMVAVPYVITRNWRYIRMPTNKPGVLLIGISLLVSLLLVGIFIVEKQQAISLITNTSYPGERIVASGGFSPIQLLMGHLNIALQSSYRSAYYSIKVSGPTNQSELSGFILISLYILPLLIYLALKRIKKIRLFISENLELCVLMSILIIYLAWLFVPHLSLIGRILLLDKVPQNRLIIGIGMINFLLLPHIINFINKNKRVLSISMSTVYALLLCIFMLIYGALIHHLAPKFLGYREFVVLSFIVPLIVFLYSRARYTLASIGLLLFSLGSTLLINPLYVGISNTKVANIASQIKIINDKSPGVWASEDIALENIPQITNVRSITGVNFYPQLSLWRRINPSQSEVYNRYAHTTVTLDRNESNYNNPTFELKNPDAFTLNIEPCDTNLRELGVRYVLTFTPLNNGVPCIRHVKTIDSYPKSIYIYTLSSPGQ